MLTIAINDLASEDVCPNVDSYIDDKHLYNREDCEPNIDNYLQTSIKLGSRNVSSNTVIDMHKQLHK